MEGKKSTVIKVFILFSFLFSGLTIKAQDKPLCIIANPKGCPQVLTTSELKSILAGEKQQWKGSTRVVIALMKTTTPQGAATAKKIYNKSADDLNKYWLQMVFLGKTRAPNFFNSVSDLEEFVSQTPGAIGVTEQSDTKNAVIISVDGKKTF